MVLDHKDQGDIYTEPADANEQIDSWHKAEPHQ